MRKQNVHSYVYFPPTGVMLTSILSLFPIKRKRIELNQVY